MRYYFFLLIGIICCSSSAIFIKKSTIDESLLASYRTILASIILLPFALKKTGWSNFLNYLKVGFWPGAILAIHFITWNTGVRKTYVTNSSLIVNMTPLATPFFLALFVKEKITGYEKAGTIIAFAGVFFMAINDYQLSSEFFMGDLICFFSMLFFAAYLILGRKNRHLDSLVAYITSVYLVCGILCLIFALANGVSLTNQLDQNNIIQILNLAIITTIIGHSLLNLSMKHLRGQIVSILNQGQFISAGILAYFLLAEIPHQSFYIAMVLLFIGSYIATKKSKVEKMESKLPISSNTTR